MCNFSFSRICLLLSVSYFHKYPKIFDEYRSISFFLFLFLSQVSDLYFHSGWQHFHNLLELFWLFHSSMLEYQQAKVVLWNLALENDWFLPSEFQERFRPKDLSLLIPSKAVFLPLHLKLFGTYRTEIWQISLTLRSKGKIIELWLLECLGC